MRTVTHKYKDGSVTSYQWLDLFDGEWPYPKNCTEVIFKFNVNKPTNEVF